MNLTTHWIVAVALGIGIFHNVQIAFVLGLGALIPDLDREYLFVAKDFIGRHQLHRSLFHNFVVIGLLYLVNPFLALGALSHSLLDMFTSATDRGVELLYPFTRVVRSFHFTIEGKEAVRPRKAEWWVEDPWRLLQKTSDRDLQEPSEQPWRRSYGPFKNSRIVDWGIFFAALAFLPISYFSFGNSFYLVTRLPWYAFLSLLGIGTFYGLGEWYRRKLIQTKSEETNWLVLSILLAGLALFIGGGVSLYQQPSLPSTILIGSALASVFIGFVASYLFVRARHQEDLSL